MVMGLKVVQVGCRVPILLQRDAVMGSAEPSTVPNLMNQAMTIDMIPHDT